MAKRKAAVPVERVEKTILYIKGQIILDADLARLYGVTTKRLNEQVRRNRDRFPEDFIFQLSTEEKAEVVANCDHFSSLKFSKSLPYAFTEHGRLWPRRRIGFEVKEKRASYGQKRKTTRA